MTAPKRKHVGKTFVLEDKVEAKPTKPRHNRFSFDTPEGRKNIHPSPRKKGCTSLKKFDAYLASLTLKQLKKEAKKPQASLRRSMIVSTFLRNKLTGNVSAFVAIHDRLYGTPIKQLKLSGGTNNHNRNDNTVEFVVVDPKSAKK